MAYTLIASQTLLNPTSDLTFSSIPQIFKDLMLEITGNPTAAGNFYWQFNNDTATNYSSTYLFGNGSASGSGRISSISNGYIDTGSGYLSQKLAIANLFSYSNINVNKTWIGRISVPAGGTEVCVGLWRSNAAITSLKIQTNSGGFGSGMTFKLWGIS